MPEEDRIKCVYRAMYETGKSTTFEDPCERLQKCIQCTGYDTTCAVYQDVIALSGRINRLREAHKREIEDERLAKRGMLR